MPSLINSMRYRAGRAVRQNPMRLLAHMVKSGLPVNSVIHCGAHLAQERFAYEALGAQKIIWVEGSEATFLELCQSLENDKTAGRIAAQHTAVHGLLYSEEGLQLALHGFSNNGESNSVLRSAEGFGKRWPQIGETGQSELHSTTTLDGVLAKHMPDGADLLVLDLQGAELDVLSAGTIAVSHAKAIICEVSKVEIYQGGAQYRDVVAWMKKAGFSDMHRAHTCGDVLFVRNGLF